MGGGGPEKMKTRALLRFLRSSMNPERAVVLVIVCKRVTHTADVWGHLKLGVADEAGVLHASLQRNRNVVLSTFKA
jgi:hypothetical protein